MNQFKIYPLIGVSILALLIVFSSCQGQEKQNRAPLQTQKQNQIKEALIDANKQRMLEEVENINNYVDRHQLIMKTTPTGIRIMTIKEGINKDESDTIKKKLEDAGAKVELK